MSHARQRTCQAILPGAPQEDKPPKDDDDSDSDSGRSNSKSKIRRVLTIIGLMSKRILSKATWPGRNSSKCLRHDITALT